MVVQGVKEQQGLYHMNSSSVQQRHQQQQQQQQRERLVSWGSLNALSEQLGAQELRRLPQSLPMQYQSQIAMPSDADLDPLDPAFLASINDPCSPRRVRARAHLPSLAEAHISYKHVHAPYTCRCQPSLLFCPASIGAGLQRTGRVWVLIGNSVSLMNLEEQVWHAELQDLFSYDLNAAGSCLTEDRSEQTLLFSHARHEHQRHVQPMKAPHFSSPTGASQQQHPIASLPSVCIPLHYCIELMFTQSCDGWDLCAGDYRPGPSYGMSPTGRTHISLPLDMSTPDSHMWMAQGEGACVSELLQFILLCLMLCCANIYCVRIVVDMHASFGEYRGSDACRAQHLQAMSGLNTSLAR